MHSIKRIRGVVFLLVITALMATLCACSLLSGGTTSSSTGSTGSTTRSYNVKLHDIDGFLVYDFIDKNTKIIKKPEIEPTKEGYVFVRWCSDEECTTELPYGTVISSDLDIYAQWDVQNVTVTLYNTLDRTSSTLLTEYNEKVTLPDRQAAGYTFLGWFTDEGGTVEFDKTKKLTEDITLCTGWSVIQYVIHYHTDGGAVDTDAPTEYTMFRETTLPTSCEKTGYSFVGWYDNEQKTGSACVKIARGQQGEKNFYAKYVCVLAEVEAKYPDGNSVIVNINDITIRVRYDGGTISLTDYLTFSDNATYSISKNGSSVSAIVLQENTGDTTITHEYDLSVTSEDGSTVKTYHLHVQQFTSYNLTVNYYSNGVLYSSDNTKKAGGQAFRVSDPTPEAGYLFDCWVLGSLSGEEYDFDSILTQDINLYARYSTIEYSISYSLGYSINGVNPATYTVEDAVTLQPAIPTNEEYVFEGWYDSALYNNKVTGITEGTIGEKTFYARFSLRNRILKDFSQQLTGTPADGYYTVSLAELDDYFRYAMYNRLTDLRVKVTGGTPGAVISPYLESIPEISRTVDGGSISNRSTYPDLTADSEGVWDMSSDYKITLQYYDYVPSYQSQGSDYPQVLPKGTHFSALGRDGGFDDFAIDHVADGMPVTDSEQLVYAVEHGYRPIPTPSSAAEAIYDLAKGILRDYVDDDMTDYEKALAIYEYIIQEVSYDHAVFNAVSRGDITNADASKYACFYLEGVFENKIAVCDGYSKAFMLLCRIEGIRVVQIEGVSVADSTGHAWNKICLSVDDNGRAWYVVDATSGDTLTRFSVNDAREVMTHSYFLYTDAVMETRYTEDTGEYDYEAETTHDYYGNDTFTQDEVEYTYAISSDEQMAAYLKHLLDVTTNSQSQISLDLHICLENNEYDPFTYGENEKPNGIRMSILQMVGSRINNYSITWVQASGTNYFTFLCTRE